MKRDQKILNTLKEQHERNKKQLESDKKSCKEYEEEVSYLLNIVIKDFDFFCNYH